VKGQALTPQAVLQGLALTEDSERKLLGVQIIESLEEESWFFQFQDSNYKGNHRWIKARAAQVLSDNAGFLPVFEGETLRGLYEEDLKTDFDMLKKKGREIAKVAEVMPVQYRYCLKRPSSRKAAYWEIVLLDNQGESLGQLTLEARSGKTVMASWQKDEEQKNTAAKSNAVAKPIAKTPKKKENFGDSVEKTFRGIGADLEEFFTGKRTVDKD